ncbi:MAG TPA: gas vesicle protein GvpD P-loop domain-containing protein [Nitrososphaeraceae archaeon]|nr:gas vesicle protein GvpD P-loop domain-containing protein [Nitrososphaeraceae archaeon]
MGPNVKSSKNGIENWIGIPHELMQFVQRNTYSLLIKGFPGTGKTTLSLTILRALKVKSNFFYISTRISPKQLFLHYPWLGRFIGSSKASETDDVPGQGYGLSIFEDARLDEPESLFERITNQLMDVKAPIIIIDSWDAIASFMDKEARLNNERVLQIWRERAGAKLIFITEDPNYTTLDFLVDGIVELRRKFYADWVIREIFLPKLRGIMIQKPSYIYSLNAAVFTTCGAYRPADFAVNTASTRINKKESSLSHGRYIATGYHELDDILGGGFVQKGVILIEMESDVSAWVAVAFLSSIISNFRRTSNIVLFHPFDGINAQDVMNYLRLEPNSNTEESKLKMLCYDEEVDEKSNQNFRPLKDEHKYLEKYLEYFHEVIAKTRIEYPNKLLLNIIGTNTAQKLTAQADTGQTNMSSFIRRNSDLSVIVSRKLRNTHQQFSNVCDVRLRFFVLNGSLFLQSVIPWRSLYSVLSPSSSGCNTIKLNPVV